MNNQKLKCKVSSVLNRNVKEYGKNYMFDDNDETCWSSDQGTPQWVEIQFENNDSIEISSFDMQFQGGFVGQDCYLEIKSKDSDDISKHSFYPEDVNNLQHFTLTNNRRGHIFRFVFNSSTDFFGRIVIYKLLLNEFLSYFF